MKTTQYYITKEEYSPVLAAFKTMYMIPAAIPTPVWDSDNDRALKFTEEEAAGVMKQFLQKSIDQDWKLKPVEACPEGEDEGLKAAEAIIGRRKGAYIDADGGKDRMNRPERKSATEVGMGLAYKRQRILKTASDLISRERQGEYGNPRDNFANVANLWNDFLRAQGISDVFSNPITPSDVACMMILLKIARIGRKPDKDDNWIDIAGYAGLGAEVANPE